MQAERSWAERNGNSTSEAEWSPANSSSSPRKDFSQLRSGPDGSWRRNRVDEDGKYSIDLKKERIYLLYLNFGLK